MGSPIFTVLMFVILLGAWWFMSRATKKQQTERQNTLNAMKPGDDVVTIGGLHGVLSEVNEVEKTVTIDCEGVYLVFSREAIRTVTPGKTVTTDPVVTSVDETVTEVQDTVEQTEDTINSVDSETKE